MKATSHYLIHKAKMSRLCPARTTRDGWKDGCMDRRTISDEPFGFGSHLLDRYRL